MVDIARLGIEIDTRGLRNGERDLNRFGASASSAASATNTATRAVTSLVGALAVGKLIEMADSFAMMTARVSRFTESATATGAVMQQLTNYANASGQALGEVVSVFASISSSANDLGKSQSSILRFTQLVNEIGYAGGSSADAIKLSMRQMSQSFAGGIVRAEEFNSIIENTPEIVRAAANGMGISMGEIRQKMLAGKLSAVEFYDAIMSQGSAIDAMFNQMPRTVAAAMQTLGNEFTALVGTINNTTGATGGLSSAIDNFSGGIVAVKENLGAVVTAAEALALVFGSRLVGGMVAVSAAKLQVVAADRALVVAEVSATNAAVRKAVADKSAALSAVALAQAEYNAAKGSSAEMFALQALVAAKTAARNASLNLVVATQAQTVAQRAAAVGANALRGAMAMLGGPAGVIMLAASALYFFYQKSQESKQGALDFADSVDITTQALRNMTPVAAAAANAKLTIALQEQEESAEDLRDELQALEDKYRSGTSASGNYQLSQSQLADLQNQIAIKAGEVEEAENKVSQTRSKQHAITALLNGTLRENYVAMQNSNSVTGIANGIQSVFNGVLNTGNKLLQQRNNYVMLGNGAKSNLTATDQKYLTQLENEIALEKELDPIKRARIKAEQEAAAQGLSASGTTQYINQSVKLAEIQAKNDAASKSLTAAHKSEASAIKEAAKSAEEYAQFSQELSRLNATEAQQIKNWQDDKLADLDSYHAQGLVKASEYEFGKQAIMAEANKRTEALAKQQREKAAQAMISASSGVDISGGLTSLKSMYDQRLITEQQYNQQSALLKEQWKSKYAEADNWLVTELATYKQMLADKTINEQQYNAASNQLQLQWAQKRREVLLAQRTSEQTEMQTWLANIKANMTSSTGLMTETFNSFTSNISSGLTNAIIQADSFGDAMRNAAASFAQSMIQAIIQVMAQKAVMWALEKSLGAATNDAYVGMVSGQAAAGVNLAAINAYSSTAAIPIVGPEAAPAAAAAATAATTPFATAAVASAASSISGMAHDGISSVPSEGTWLLNKGERVYTNDSAKQLDQMYKNSQQSSGGNVTVNVSLQETSDTSQQGTTSQTTGDDGSVQINVFVADIRSEGSMAQVLERTYGLTRMGA